MSFAVFVIAEVNGGFAATSRALDRSADDAGITCGLPGGKVDPGETDAEACVRESHEEGWDVELISMTPIYSCEVQGKPVSWFAGRIIRQLTDYKEMHRIRNIVANVAQLHGFSNEVAIATYLSKKGG